MLLTRYFLFLILVWQSCITTAGTPSLKVPINWVIDKNPLPSISASYNRSTSGKSISITYTEYQVPQISNEEQFKKYIGTLYPQQSNKFPTYEIRSLSSCKSRFAKCFNALVKVKNASSSSFVTLVYFSKGQSNYLGMSNLPGHEDNLITAQKIMKEMLYAVSP